MQLASAHALAHGDLTAQRQSAAVQHEVHQGLELAADQGGLEHQAAVAAGDVEQLARGVGVLGQGNGMGMHLGQGDAGMPGQRMVGPHDGDHGRDLAVPDLDVTCRRAAVGQAHIGLAAQHGLGHGGRGFHAQVELHARVLLAEKRHGAWQELDGKAARAAHTHHAPAQALQGLDVGDHTVGLQRTAARVGGQQLACRAGRHAARAALEQRHAQHLFQSGDLAAHGRGARH